MPRALQRFWDGNNGAGFCGFDMTMEQSNKNVSRCNNFMTVTKCVYWSSLHQLKIRDGSMIATLCLLNIYFTQFQLIFLIASLQHCMLLFCLNAQTCLLLKSPFLRFVILYGYVLLFKYMWHFTHSESMLHTIL
jgi:hypothetical protein